MKNNWLQSLMRRSAEIVVTLVLVLIFFGIFTTLLFKVFPSGITLTQLLERRVVAKNVGGEAVGGRGSVIDVEGTQGEMVAATLTMTENEVKSKSATSIAWEPAKNGMQLFDRDAVQTFRQASARINFDSRNYLAIGSSSLVIIKRIEKDPNRNQRRSVMVMVDGELQGRIASEGQSPLHLEIATPSSVARVLGGEGGAQSDFRISINPDSSSSIVVYKGQAEVSALGRTVRVGENSGVTVKQGEAPKMAVPLPLPPVLTMPDEHSVISFRELAPQVRLAWAGTAGSTYRLQLARDSGFKEMVIDRRLAESEFIHGNLKKGSYFWRAARIEEGREGLFGETRHFEIAQRLTPPLLQVAFPPGVIQEDRFVLSGVSSPGARVFVGGKPVAGNASGAFSHEVVIHPGMNLVTVEAIDVTGNVTYRSQYVQGRF